MSHYGYVSEQLLSGELLPRRDRRRQRRRRRLKRREPQSLTQRVPVERAVEVGRIRSHPEVPATGH